MPPLPGLPHRSAMKKLILPRNNVSFSQNSPDFVLLLTCPLRHRCSLPSSQNSPVFALLLTCSLRIVVIIAPRDEVLGLPRVFDASCHALAPRTCHSRFS